MSSPYTLFPTDVTSLSLSLLSCYFHGNCSDELHCLVPPVRTFTARTFTARTCYATSTESNQPDFLCIPNMRKVHSVFSQELSLYGTDSRLDSFRKTTILTSSSRGSILIYSHNLHFQPSSISFISHASFTITISIVTL